MITLTPEQRREVAEECATPPRVIDPDTQTTYVLIPEEVFDRVRSLLGADDESFARGAYPLAMRAFAIAGWDDPAMDIYNDLDPRKPS